MAKTKPQSTGWENRIIESGEMPAHQYLAHDKNARRHPNKQRDALRGSLDSVGWVAPVIVSARTGKLLDGHARIEEALSRDEAQLVPFVKVDVSEQEEALILSTYDPITGLATYDREALDALLRETSTGDAALQELLSELAAANGVVPTDADWGAALGNLPEGDRAPFQQMTFTLSDAQVELVKQALAQAKDAGEFENTGNENSNGNALARIAEAYLG